MDVIAAFYRVKIGIKRGYLNYAKPSRAIKHVEVTLRNYRKDAELFYNKLNITPLFDNHGNVIYYLGVQYDVTEQVRAEEEINKLHVRLEEAGGQARP